VIYRRVLTRVIGFLVRWGLLEHPYGREYAREQYSLTGRHAHHTEPRHQSRELRTRAAMIVVGLALASLLATGLLFATAT
jgi:hypothetical protein